MIIFIDVLDTSSCSLCGMRGHVTSNHGNVSLQYSLFVIIIKNVNISQNDKAHPEINIAQAVGVYEFCLVPRSLFAQDGSMLHCSRKSALMNAIEKHVNPEKSTTEWRQLHPFKGRFLQSTAWLSCSYLTNPRGSLPVLNQQNIT